MHGDNFRDGAHRGRERLVGDAEPVDDGEFGVDVDETLVVDDEQGVDLLGQCVESVERLVDLAFALEEEGDGDDAHGEDALGACFAGNDGRGSGARASAHTRRDEDHVGVGVERPADFLHAVLGQFASLLGPASGTQARAELEVLGHDVVLQCLTV